MVDFLESARRDKEPEQRQTPAPACFTRLQHNEQNNGGSKQVFGHDEEGTEVEPEIEEDVSEVEDNTDFDPDFEETDQSTDGEGEAPEEQSPEETFQSKSGHLLWSSSPQDRGSRARVENIIKMTPGPTRYATFHDIKSSFQLFFTRLH
ncbi:hypothetical protein MHYP_G00012080 [Metynnis hypsauchen]